MQVKTYLSQDGLDELHLEQIESLKAQERIALQALLQARVLELQMESGQLATQLEEQATKMKDYARKTVAGNIEEALKGKTAQEAKTYLSQDLEAPELDSPIHI